MVHSDSSDSKGSSVMAPITNAAFDALVADHNQLKQDVAVTSVQYHHIGDTLRNLVRAVDKVGEDVSQIKERLAFLEGKCIQCSQDHTEQPTSIPKGTAKWVALGSVAVGAIAGIAQLVLG